MNGYLRKLTEYGPLTIGSHLAARMRTKLFTSYWQTKKSPPALPYSFLGLWVTITKNHFLDVIFLDNDFHQSLPLEATHASRITDANNAALNCFSILGSGKRCFPARAIPWQHDFKCTNGNQQTNWDRKPGTEHTALFYRDIIIGSPVHLADNDYAPDIKVPWELARLQHIFSLGCAYQNPAAPAADRAAYAATFERHVADWIDKNRFLYGAGWVCPMDVGIRALNLIWGTHFFHAAPSIPHSFWKQLTTSLYQHALYLENNWEKTLKPHNHYLANLIGYLYLARFFESIPRFRKKLSWCWHEIIRELNRQVLPDGTNYEGSTAYHRLVTELFFHAYLIAKHHPALGKTPQFAHLRTRLCAMWQFLADCTDARGNLVTIGDDDSGKIVAGICPHSGINITNELSPKNAPAHIPRIKQYQHFGLSIISNAQWHMTFRHPQFSIHQPTGHFHEDILAITLSINGVPILIDPGSYLYTAHPAWRNRMRSASAHSTFAPTSTHDRFDSLFELHRTPCNRAVPQVLEGDAIQLEDFYEVAPGFLVRRSLEWRQQEQRLLVQDLSNHEGSWHLLFHPEIALQQTLQGQWLISRHGKAIARLNSPHHFEEVPGWAACGYGTIKQAPHLRAAQASGTITWEISLID